MSSANQLEVTVEQVKAKQIQEESFLLLDCREQDEYDLVHIEGSRLLPMSELEDRINELQDHKEKPIIVYCHHGRRSMMVTRVLLNNGYSDVKSMAGGIDQWAESIEPEMTRY